MVEHTFSNSIHGCLSKSSSFYLEKQHHDENIIDQSESNEDKAYKRLDFAATPTASPNKENNFSCGIANNANFFACKLKENLTNINKNISTGSHRPMFRVGDDDDYCENDITDLPNIHYPSAPIKMKPPKGNLFKNDDDDEATIDEASYLSSTLKESNSLLSSSIISRSGNESESGSGSGSRTEISSSSGSDSCVNNCKSADNPNLATKQTKTKKSNSNRRRRQKKQNQLLNKEQKESKNNEIRSEYDKSLNETCSLKDHLLAVKIQEVQRNNDLNNSSSKNTENSQQRNNINFESLKLNLENSNESKSYPSENMFETDEILSSDTKNNETSNCKYKSTDHDFIKDKSDFHQSEKFDEKFKYHLNKSQFDVYYDTSNDLEFYLDDDFESASNYTNINNTFNIHNSNNSINGAVNQQNFYKQNENECDTNDEDSSTDYFLASSVDTVINAPFLRAAMISAATAVKIKSISNNNLNNFVSSSVGASSATSASMIHTSSSFSINSASHFYLFERLNEKSTKINGENSSFDDINCLRMSSNPNINDFSSEYSSSNDKNYKRSPDLPSINKNNFQPSEMTSTESVPFESFQKNNFFEKTQFSKPIQFINNFVNVAKSTPGAFLMVNFGSSTFPSMNKSNCKDMSNNNNNNCNKSSESAVSRPMDEQTAPSQPRRIDQKNFQDSNLSNNNKESEKNINEDFILDKQKHHHKTKNQKSNFDNNKKLKQTTKSLSASSALSNYQVNVNNKDSKSISLNNGNNNNNSNNINESNNISNNNNKRSKNKSNKSYKYQYQHQQQIQQNHQQTANSASAPNSTKNSMVLNNNDHSSNYKNTTKQKFKINNNIISNNSNKTK